MNQFENYEQFTRIAVELLQTQNPRAVMMLKSFLTYVPKPSCIRAILTAAIGELIDTSPIVICWLLSHPEYLKPEIEVTSVVIEKLSARLMGLGFVEGEDFQVNSAQTFEVSEAARLALITHSRFFEIQDCSPILEQLHGKHL